MFGPARALYAIRPHSAVGILAAVGAVTLLFTATPFLIPVVAERYGISEGWAGTLSVAQVGAFALANFVLPRVVAPTGRPLRWSVVGLLVLNALSALPNQFWMLLGLRILAGAAAGTITWIAWADAMRRPRSLAEVAAMGPIIATLGAPLVSVVAQAGDRAVYVLLAVAVIPAALQRVEVEGLIARRSGVSRSRSNRLLLLALLMLTLGGAALFVFEAVIGREVYGLHPVTISIAFSLNAAFGLLGARLASRHRRPGIWLLTAAPAAAMTALGGPQLIFFVGMAWWGFAFWMGLPGVLQMLAARSLAPDERAGDAQGVLALGRAVGPFLGGGFINAGAYGTLGLLAGAGLAVSGSIVIGVQEGRHHLPPTDPRAVGTGPYG